MLLTMSSLPRASLLVLASALASSCATTIESQSMVPKSIEVAHRHACTVRLDAKGQPDPWIGDARISTEVWLSALTSAIEESHLFAEVVQGELSSPGVTPPYELQVDIVDLQEPEFELEMLARLKVAWRLVETESDRVVWERTITSRGRIDPEASWNMSERALMAIQRAVRLNIEAGIERLSQLEL